MNVILLGIGVFFVITTLQRLVVLRFWDIPLALSLSFGGAWWAHLPWWSAISAAGISTIANGLETLLLAMADHAILDLPRPRNRR